MSKIKKSEMNMISVLKTKPERLKMLEDQVILFEAERKQLVEAAFDSEKKCRVLNKSLVDKCRQIDSLSTMLSEREEVVSQFSKLKIKMLWVGAVLLLSLIANIAFALYLC